MKFNQGVVALSLVFGLVIMAIALPVAGQLALKNQDNRNRAAGCPMCYDDYYCNASTGYKCVPPDWVKPTSSPGPQATRTPTSRPSRQCSSVVDAVECAYIPGCNWNGNKCTGAYPTPTLRPQATRTPTKPPQACNDNDDCPNGQTCSSSGKCVLYRKPGGSSCNEDWECLSDLCMSGKCAWKCTNGICPEMRKPGGSSCNEDWECLSDLCMSGKCTWKCTNGICPTFKPTQPQTRSCKCLFGIYRGTGCGNKLNKTCGQ